MSTDFLDATQLIRSVQRAEGNTDCFRRRGRECDQLICAWRRYCLEGEGEGLASQNHPDMPVGGTTSC